MAYFTKDYLDFFIELASNNHKDWFDKNRKRYEESVKKPFNAFVQAVIDEMVKIDKTYEGLEPKHCNFRINRDIRFSKDKTPYKLKMSAVIRPGGKSRKGAKGVYFELGPEHVRIYGGIFEADKDDLYSMREGIVNDMKGFKKTYSNKKFSSLFGEIHGNKNKIIPKEFREAAEKEPLIYNKQFYFYTQYEPEEIHSDDLVKTIVEGYKTGLPVGEFFWKIINN